MKFKALAGTLVLIASLGANSAMAVEKGDWLWRFGASTVDPKSNNHAIVGVDSASSFTTNIAWMFTDHFSVEVLAAYPFEHDITLNGTNGTKVASTKHLPPTVSVQYHFMPDRTFKPYIGAGINYTTFFNTKTFGALEGTDLDLGDSFGLAGEIGADIILNDTWFLNASFRYIDIETDAKLDGAKLGAVKIDPYVYGIHVGMKF